MKLPVNDVKLRTGPIDVLIGINYHKFQVGKTLARDWFGCTKSLLGWAIFGINSNKSDVLKQVLHVLVAAPVDMK